MRKQSRVGGAGARKPACLPEEAGPLPAALAPPKPIPTGGSPALLRAVREPPLLRRGAGTPTSPPRSLRAGQVLSFVFSSVGNITSCRPRVREGVGLRQWLGPRPPTGTGWRGGGMGLARKDRTGQEPQARGAPTGALL